jgi:hypothetical protein
MTRTIAGTMNDQMLEIVEQFLAQGGETPINLDALARFAIRNSYWQGQGTALVQLCKRDLSRAFREQYHTDPQGRSVRTFHAVSRPSDNGKQGVFWADMRDATEEHMEQAFAQRRNLIVGECLQLKRDVDSYNDNNANGATIQMVFDFSEDIAEREQPIRYRPQQPR